jgi:hypothetical protein
MALRRGNSRSVVLIHCLSEIASEIIIQKDGEE